MAASPLPQLTVKAIILGIVLSVVLAGANAYLGLFAGLTVSASIPAAVISMAILSLFKSSNILENNIVQTAASAGESLAAGVIFTLPALILLGYWEVFDNLWVMAIAGLGGLLGVLFTIPLRRSLIVEEGLTYPEGTATAEVLKVGESARAKVGGTGIAYLAWAGVCGALAKLSETGLRIWEGTAQAAGFLGTSTIAYVGANLSPALLSVGYIVGLNIAVLVLAGGVISWYVAIPIYSTFFLEGNPALQAVAEQGAVDLAFAIWTSQIRYLGVGAMLVGGIWALVSMRGSILSGVKSGLAQYREGTLATTVHTERDTPMPFVLGGIGLFVVPIFALYVVVVDSAAVALAMTLVMVVAGFLFSAVAAYMSGLVGSSNNPVSGITIATILFSALLLLFLLGNDAGTGPVAAILIGAVICCAAAIAGDNLQDLKAGYIVGATPWRQQVMQAVGVVSAVLLMAPILNLLLQAYGIGAPTAEQPNSLLAPQATLMASVAQGVFGDGLPWTMVAGGAGIGVVIIVIDEWAKRSGRAWRAPVLAVAVGIYLPLELAVPIAVGGVLAHIVGRRQGAKERGRTGMLFAAGLITGEALVGIVMAIPIVVSENPDVLALPFNLGSVGGIVVFVALAAALFRVAQRDPTPA
ncbi:MAG: oligopeptide transporter, OPT family [Gammaproteobacteria bacterium]|nr:oligopeptide transporter, OPT family [Gammaproteobacteria bacterium]